MPTVQQIHDALFELAPAYMQESWDNTGLLCGRSDREVRRVLVALDPFYNVAQEAVRFGAELLVTHHPLSFGFKAVNDLDPVGRTMLYLIENGVSAVNLHTNLDSAPGGVNDCLACALGLEDVQILVPGGENYGLGRCGVTPACALADFLERVQTSLGCAGLRYVDGGRQVSKVAVGGGACAEFLPNALARGCDTFVTGDVKYNGFADAQALGINLIDAGHFCTENVVCEYLAGKLRGLFPGLQVRIAENHTDVVKFL